MKLLFFLFPMNNLKQVDQELARIRMRTSMLLKEKQKILKQMTGMDFHNDSDIDAHLNRTFSQPEEFQYTETKKSEHFEIVRQHDFTFKDIGGMDTVKEELMQCSDLLINYAKYAKYNVRTPKGLILEGPPGNGKTLLAKGFSGELDIGFIPVSGAQFQEKYVGVGAARVRELFELARENTPCIIFMDEIDAIGRKRSSGESQDHDSTLNELLVNLDGFKSSNGIFLMGATNRMDLLDDALTRPGRIDKKIYVNTPDKKTREAIIAIHLKGKPYQFHVPSLVDMTAGYSGAQLENVLNEAMLYALRQGRESMTMNDVELMANRIMVGVQSTEHVVGPETIYQIAVHEMGHALIAYFTRARKVIKVTINLWSPTSLGFTLFEPNGNLLITREHLMYELMILLGGRVAEEIVCETLTTGVANDFEKAKGLAEKMVVEYGMGKNTWLPHGSDRYREMIDDEIESVLQEAYDTARTMLLKMEVVLKDFSTILAKEHVLKEEDIRAKLNKY
jgi:cell division protease FtsH